MKVGYEISLPGARLQHFVSLSLQFIQKPLTLCSDKFLNVMDVAIWAGFFSSNFTGAGSTEITGF